MERAREQTGKFSLRKETLKDGCTLLPHTLSLSLSLGV